MKLIDNYLLKHGFVQQKSAAFIDLEVADNPTRRPEQAEVRDYKTFMRTFKQLPWLYAGVMAVAVAATKPSLKVFKQTKSRDGVTQTEVQGEEINDRLELPNSELTYRELMQITAINMMLAGNAYINLVGTKEDAPISQTNLPVEMWWVKPDQMQPQLAVDGSIECYIYTSKTGVERKLGPSEIIHFKLPNPDSYFLGMGVVEPATDTATLEVNALNYNKSFFENNATPTFVLTHPGTPGEPERKRFWAAWDERFKGAKKGHKTALLYGGMKAETIGSSPKDIQFAELRKMNREEILASIGVPPSVVGLLEYANYSNMEVQQLKFWEDTVIPLMNLISDKLSLRFAPLFNDDYWVEFDYTNIAVLQAKFESKFTSLVSCDWLTVNEKRIATGYKPLGKEGDEVLISFGKVPLSQVVEPAAAAPTSAAAALPSKSLKRKSFWTEDIARQKQLWQAFEKRVNAEERAFAPAVKKFMKRQADEVKSALKKYSRVEEIKLDAVFDIESETMQYADSFEKRYTHAFKIAGSAGLASTKCLISDSSEEEIKTVGFKITEEQLAKLRKQINKAAKYFNETTFSEIESAVIAAKLTNMTIEELTQDLWLQMNELSVSRARLIARTEMARTENFGEIEGYRQNEYVTKKGWMCSFVDDSREDHKEANDQEVDLDADFVVGGESMQHPLDDRASAGNVCNCLCATYPVVEK
jgi:HK97 family phage portal protein